MKNKDINAIDKHWRLANYLTVTEMYIENNVLLERELCIDDLKERNPGHWGAAPAINFIYAHLNAFIKRHNLKTILVIGTGHAGAPLLANLYIEGSISNIYPDITYDFDGIFKLINSFGKENGFRTEINPQFPGTIYDGGELGYALGVAFGAALDNKDMFIPCVIGDGEAETGTTMTSWFLNRIVDKHTTGNVLPILNLNGYKMGSKSILGTMTDEELKAYFGSIGYETFMLYGQHEEMYEILNEIYYRFKQKTKDDFKWPMIILKTPKGWTAPDDEIIKISGDISSHKNPLAFIDESNKKNYLEKWLRSYKIHELYSKREGISKDILEIIPDNKIGSYKNIVPKKKCMTSKEFAIQEENYKNTTILNNYLNHILDMKNGFRIFSPDELQSNGLGKVLKEKDNKIIEILNENVCQALLQGYIQTGRRGILVSYEAFMPIITSMVSQFMKYIYQANKQLWKNEIPSLNYLLTSVCWENNYSHQNPEFINNLLGKAYNFVNVYMPPDANTLLYCMQKIINSVNCINTIVVSKGVMPQYKDKISAKELVEKGIEIWYEDTGKKDIIIVASGDYIIREVEKAKQKLKQEFPHINVRIVYVCELSKIGDKQIYENALDDGEFETYFLKDIPIIFYTHGYESVIKALLFNRKSNDRFEIIGYKDRSDISSDSSIKLKVNGISPEEIVEKITQKLK